jgi:hypothetical protein
MDCCSVRQFPNQGLTAALLLLLLLAPPPLPLLLSAWLCMCA